MTTALITLCIYKGWSVHSLYTCNKIKVSYLIIFRIIMKTSTLSVICVFMTLAMALSVYGMGGYGYYVPSYGAQQGSNPLGIGQGGLCKLSLRSYYSFHFLLDFPPSSDRNVSYLSSKMNKIYAFILRCEFET